MAGFYNTETCMREGKGVACVSPAETFMCACRRSMKAARFHEQKCANNHQLIVAGAERFTTRMRSLLPYGINKQNAVCATYIYMQTLMGVFFVHGNAHTHACLTQ